MAVLDDARREQHLGCSWLGRHDEGEDTDPFLSQLQTAQPASLTSCSPGTAITGEVERFPIGRTAKNQLVMSGLRGERVRVGRLP